MSDDGRQLVVKAWAGLLSFPMNVSAASEARSLWSLASEWTGLSISHLTTRGVHVKSEKQWQKIQLSCEKATRNQLLRSDFSVEEADEFLLRRPKTVLAAFAFEFGYQSKSLDRAIALCEVLDQHVSGAIGELERNDLLGYQRLVQSFLLDERLDLASVMTSSTFVRLESRLREARDWSELAKPTNELVNFVCFLVLAAIDVDWGASYLTSLEPKPTLVWLFPRVHREFDLRSPKGTGRIVLHSPTKLLLELLWCLAKRGASPNETWPADAPGPAQLASDIAMVSVADQKIRHWTSGARPLRYSEALEVWQSLTANLLGGRQWPAPRPWLAVALWMNRQLVQRRKGSTRLEWVIIPSAEDYGRMWTVLRDKWAASLPEAGRKPWPDWITARAVAPGMDLQP